MVQLVVSKEKLDEIMGLAEPFDLCDESGRVMAQATVTRLPKSTEQTKESDLRRLVPFSDDELERRRNEPARPITELLAKMRAARNEA